MKTRPIRHQRLRHEAPDCLNDATAVAAVTAAAVAAATVAAVAAAAKCRSACDQ